MSDRRVSFYTLAWRWHFYAGLFVAPFMMLLALTGLVYLFKPQLDLWLDAELRVVAPAGPALSADALLARVGELRPAAQVSKYLPPPAADRSAEFVASEDGRELSLFLDPYRGTLLGTQDARYNLQAVARALHGELMLGTPGDRLVELAAGWGVVLTVSGLYLWWPRGRGLRGVLWPRLNARGRLFWRDLHAVLGAWGALLLLFMLLTGMTWTGFWGKAFAGAWNHFPAAMWDAVPTSGAQAGSLNRVEAQTVPWPVENTPLPVSTGHAGHAGHGGGDGHGDHGHEPAPPRIGLQAVVERAAAAGVVPGYSITLPVAADGVYTVAIFADDPRDDATLHLDAYTGAVLADVRWRDYGAVARTVETGVMLHEGKLFGPLNQALMAVVCLAILLGSASGLAMWWLRRPQGRLGVPPLPHGLPLWKGGVAIIVALGLLFPLVGASLLAVWALDRLVLARLAGNRPLAE
ncbi:PepSY-associated TM helix domain-containing protein [Pseudomonas mangiferae]|uniref:PepSY domain-containing protein n=1 Tax=Pseudomonas mangiferae TaxID=2593654 RepID=A0A553GWK4_9PSED|nr:PepSY domain-containing protein [Pseudomonas mangiferae]TRX73894.1 PepSY domain-containing protein [Pseudomonas mangiferae]